MNFPVELPADILQKASSLRVVADDIVEHFTCGSGKGGQKINKTSSCVLLKHVPTGIEVRCQKHREQSKNRVSAYKLLINKIEDMVKGRESERAKKIFKFKKQKQRRSARAKAKMVEAKRGRGAIKESRRGVSGE